MLSSDGYPDQSQSGSMPDMGQSSAILDPTLYIQTANAAASVLLKGTDINTKMDEIKTRFTESESTVRRYFTVDYKSVITKITNLACPFNVKNWSRSVEDGKPAYPIYNPNLPEFYTPLVFLFSFLLLSSVYRGVNEEFSFEYISYLFIKTCGYLAFLVLLSKLIFFIVNIPNSYSLLQLVADLSVFTFYTAVVNVFVCTFSSLRWIAIIYCIVASFFWSIRTLNPKSGIQSVHPSPAHTYSIVIVAALQAFAPIILSEKVIVKKAVAAAAAAATGTEPIEE
ncbi:hypothetical protein TRFO_23857 [Tritrichomonas foetus]|uniref:Protein YIF1 n=1 Tax=Tritrichomonas foetus TaxID=1144522 RepID=A0A1J4KA35_9EUKA|nr:hypothetical protein TRFO_23857 [Tritrichomonas foetus]|eukprot:OHT07818.1 hypothetical protein TRFO_23857 [Tritrichomonas foetus]